MPVSAAASEGITIKSGDELVVPKHLKQTVGTIETTVFYDQDKGEYDLGGIVIGNLDSNCGFSLSIEPGGSPRLVLRGKGKTVSKTFTKVSVYTASWTHIAFVIDRNAGEIRLFVDGEYIDSVKKDIPDFSSERGIVIGNDNITDYTRGFKGKVKSCAIYSDVRSAEVIKNDAKKLSLENGIAVWNLSQVQNTYTDLTNNGYDAQKGSRWFDEKEPITDFDYSMVLVGDTQSVTCYSPGNLHCIYDWIIDNKESKKIGYVLGLGDITDKNTESEWILAKQQISRLDSVVPYSIIRGNHDGKEEINKYFNTAPYNKSYQGSFDNTMLNTCRKFVLGTRKYLVFALDFTMNDDVVAWADKIIKNHPDHNVIITTHIYLSKSGTHLKGGTGPYDGVIEPDVLWDKLIRKHKNISLVISGHVSSDNVVYSQLKGDNGNTVTQMLVDHQAIENGGGTVVTLHFKNGSDRVSVETYSTIRNQYFLIRNQFDMNIHTIEAGTYSEKGLDQSMTAAPISPPPQTEQETTSSEITSSEDASSQQENASSQIVSSQTESETASSQTVSAPEKPEDSGNGLVTALIIISAVLVLGAGATFGYFYIYKKKKR